MTLSDLLSENFDSASDDDLIFSRKDKGYASDIVLIADEDAGDSVSVDGVNYHYLIEVFLAKDFLEDWKASIDRELSIDEAAQRLYTYGITDL
ncbi:hypothetical protein JMG10_07890 [Nostoc ellipsosporum NOK]|jgi:hypothetical protein|nr:hypothetical protein [Nostoc ellipsosporum NOK]